MFSDETYRQIIHRVVEDPISARPYDEKTLAQGSSILETIYAVFVTETERKRVASRTQTTARLTSIRGHITKLIEGLDVDTPVPRSTSEVTLTDDDPVKTQLLARLNAVHNLWQFETEDFSQSFFGFSSEIVTSLKKAEAFFLYLDQLQADFDGMNDAQQSASYFPRETDTRKMSGYRTAYRGAYPFLRKHSSETPVHLTLNLIKELYELLYSAHFGKALNSKHISRSHSERYFVSRWNSPGLRFSYRVIRELGMLESFVKGKKGFGPCSGAQLDQMLSSPARTPIALLAATSRPCA